MSKGELGDVWGGAGAERSGRKCPTKNKWVKRSQYYTALLQNLVMWVLVVEMAVEQCGASLTHFSYCVIKKDLNL